LIPLEKVSRQNGNRTRVEILASILNVAANGALKTHIMYRANLSHMQLKKYLAFLEENGLLVRDGLGLESGQAYHVTDKGLGFLREYSHLSAYLNGKPLQVPS